MHTDDDFNFLFFHPDNPRSSVSTIPIEVIVWHEI